MESDSPKGTPPRKLLKRTASRELPYPEREDTSTVTEARFASTNLDEEEVSTTTDDTSSLVADTTKTSQQDQEDAKETLQTSLTPADSHNAGRIDADQDIAQPSIEAVADLVNTEISVNPPSIQTTSADPHSAGSDIADYGVVQPSTEAVQDNVSLDNLVISHDTQLAPVSSPGAIDGTAEQNLTQTSSEPVTELSKTETLSGWPKITKHEVNPEIPPRALPPEMRLDPHFEYNEYYRKGSRNLPSVPATRIAVSLNLANTRAFRNATTKAASFHTPIRTTPRAIHREDLAGITDIPNGIIGAALYIIKESDGYKVRATPHHLEVVDEDRPDLHMARFSSFSTDLANGENPDINDYFPGDVLLVTELEPLPGRETKDIVTSFDAIEKPEKHNFWHIKTAYLVQRETRDSTIVRISGSAPSRCVLAVADNLGTHVTVHKSLYQKINSSYKEGTMSRARIFTPLLQPGALHSQVKRHAQYNRIYHCFHQNVETYIRPSVMSLSKMPPDWWSTGVDNMPFPHGHFTTRNNQGMSALFAAARLGVSSMTATANKDRDTKLHRVFINSVSHSRGKPVVTFEISGPSAPPPLRQWTRGTKCKLRMSNTVVGLDVESSEPNHHPLYHFRTVTAKPWSNKPRILDIVTKSKGSELLVSQFLEDCENTSADFPNPRVTGHAPVYVRVRQIIKSITGGAPISQLETPQTAVHTEIPGQILSEEQTSYVNAFCRTSLPFATVNCPFGVGKTLTIATALILLSKEQSGGEAIHIATAMNNADIAAVANCLSEWTKQSGLRIRAVRVISKSNPGTEMKTELDYPEIWPHVLLDFVETEDRRLGTSGRPSVVTISAFHHLQKIGRMDRKKIKNAALRKSKGPKMRRWDTFVEIFSPQVILGTTTSLADSLHQGKLKDLAQKVKTVQIDEASQFPMGALLTMAPHCTNARYGFIGNIRQLPPYADVNWPPIHHTYATESSLKNAANKSPQKAITEASHSQLNITSIGSLLFYNRILVVKRMEELTLRSTPKEARIGN